MNQQEEKYAQLDGNDKENQNNVALITPIGNEIASENTSENTNTTINENDGEEIGESSDDEVQNNQPEVNENQSTQPSTPNNNVIQDTPSSSKPNNTVPNTPSSSQPNDTIQNTPTSTTPNNTEQNTTSTTPNSTTNNNSSQNSSSSVHIGKEEYYYKQLNSHSKIIYDTLLNNKDNLKTGTYKLQFGEQFSTLLSQENGTQLLQDYYQAAMETFLYDNPDVFYLEPTKMYINIQTTKKLFTTTYEVYIDPGEAGNYLAQGYNSKQQITQYEQQIQQEASKIIAKTNGKTTYEKIQIIHDYLVDNISYEQTISKANIYNIYGALVNKECVCEGYAKAYKYLKAFAYPSHTLSVFTKAP